MRDHFGNLPIVAGMTFSRDVLLLDDCEGAFTWIPTGTGGDDVHEYLAAAAFAGSAGLHLKTRTTAAAENDILSVDKYLGYPESGLFVTRMRLASPDLSTVKAIYLTAVFEATALQKQAQLLIVPNTPLVQYQDVAGAGQEMTALAFAVRDKAWITLELAADLRTNTYLHVMYNGARVDLAGIPLYAAGAASYRGINLGLSVVTAGAAPAELYAANLYAGENLEA